MQHYQRIRDLREDNDLTQQQIADMLYINRRTYAAYENGIKNGSVISLPKDVMDVLQKYSALTERNKGKLELFLDTLCEQQSPQKETKSSV